MADERKPIWIVTIKCHNGHLLCARPFECEDEATANAAAPIVALGFQESIRGRGMKLTCGACRSTDLHADMGPTSYRTLGDAKSAIERLAAQENARAKSEYLRYKFPSTPRHLSLLDAVWIPIHDGDPTGLSLLEQHYSFRHYRDGRKRTLFVGPGEKIVLVTPGADALFIWRKFISDDLQEGINCAAFRNEGPQLSSFLIREAMRIAWDRWPGERLYTYVNPRKVRRKRDPGRCFLKAGWIHSGWSRKDHLRILEARP